MKRIFTVLIFSSFSTLFGQSITTEVADSVCLCLDKKIKETPETEFRDALNSCIGTSMTPFMEDLMKEHDLEGYTVENIREIQSKIIAVLKKDCGLIKEEKK